MDIARPYKAVSPSLDGEVLNVLAGTSRGLTGREVALLTGRSSHSGVLAVLNRLTDHGLVQRVELNRASLFTLNRDHVAAPAVEELAGLRTTLFNKIREAIDGWEIAPVHVSLFGSAARGDGDTHSDIDLFIIRPESVQEEDESWRQQLDTLSARVSRWTGNRAAIHEASERELTRLATEESPIVAQLRADAIVLSGPDIPALLVERWAPATRPAHRDARPRTQ
jgi:predicted nucleotidyltransferase